MKLKATDENSMVALRGAHRFDQCQPECRKHRWV